MKAPVTMEGGAAVSYVDIEPVAPEIPESEVTVNVVTTAPGTLGPQGIVPVGTKATIPLTLYSVNWMKPVGVGDMNKVRALLKQRAEEKAKSGQA